ncbi:LacI family DNA-binding transcriptional regulator [Pseudarthrobacter sp. NPDC092439]|uniref:LacI family DNA-binding transcriptional regulator n=1 Tax=unclassified Pseudarthrobacter TaxID=2647000 RepID=UPI00382569D6
MGITVKDVARVAGVSTATVSRALRGMESVDQDTRRHVLEVAARLQYVGSPAAAALSTGKAGSIGIITPYVDRWSFGRMLAGIERELRAANFDLLLYCTGDPSDPHPVPPHQRLARRADGFLILSVAAESPDLEELFKLRMPITMIGASAPWTSSVRIDDRAGAVKATTHLIERGHDRIGVIYGREKDNPMVLEHQRYLGYSEAMDRAGLLIDNGIEAGGDFTVQGGARAMGEILDADKPPTAVFAFSDEMAFGALQAMKGRGIQPGKEVAIIGFDGHDLAEVMDLSTVSQPLELIGSTAAKNLLADLEDPSRERTAKVLPTELIPRGSTGAGSAQGSSGS